MSLYVSIWIALSLFVAGQAFRPTRRGLSLSVAGLVAAVIHILIAMGAVHGWSHASAIAATAAQTNAFFGLDWGGGVYVNYAFIALWAGELVWWRARPERYGAWSGWSLWLVRAFYFIVIANAAVVFASGWRRILGAVLVSALTITYLRTPSRP